MICKERSEKKFEENRLVASEFSSYFPSSIDPQPYKTIIYNEINRLISYLESKFKVDNEIKKLSTFNIYIDDGTPESLSFVGKLRNAKGSISNVNSIISAIKQVLVDYSSLMKLPLDEIDLEVLHKQSDTLLNMMKKYEERKRIIESENDRIEVVAKVIDDTVRRHSKSISDRQKRNTAFLERTTTLKDSLKGIIRQNKDIERYRPTIENTQVAYSSNTIQDYSFVSRLAVKEINVKMFVEHIYSLFKANKKIDLNTITESKLIDSLLKYDGTPVLQFFKEALIKSFEDDFTPKQTIILSESDKTEELSAGLNAKIYFDLLSYENSIDGVYIIDQPEDNVSQPAIKEYLLDCFRAMGENRQVIMVSHNPQFIVNLDVDNIIYLFSGDDGKLKIQSGALEYECDEYSVLQLVADNIDGGLDSIQKRWKRYEKNNRV